MWCKAKNQLLCSCLPKETRLQYDSIDWYAYLVAAAELVSSTTAPLSPSGSVCVSGSGEALTALAAYWPQFPADKARRAQRATEDAVLMAPQSYLYDSVMQVSRSRDWELPRSSLKMQKVANANVCSKFPQLDPRR